MGISEVRYDRNIDTFSKNELKGNVKSFVHHANSIRNRDFADDYKYNLPSTRHESVDEFKAHFQPTLDIYEQLSDVDLISKVCMGDTDIFFWRAYLHVPREDKDKDKEPLVNTHGFASIFEKGEDARFSEDRANYLHSLIKWVYLMKPRPKQDSKKLPIQDFQYKYKLGQELSDSGLIQGKGISLMFNGSTLGARLSKEEELNLSKNELVRFYATAFNTLRSGDFDEYIGNHTDASKQRLLEHLDYLSPEDQSIWRNNPAERYILFLMDADPLKILFYVDGYTDEFEEFVRGERDMSSLDPTKYTIGHEYFVKNGDGYSITNAQFNSYLDRVFNSHGLFVEKTLLPIMEKGS